VASVKPNPSGRLGTDGFQIAHGTLTVRNVSLKMLIEAGYRVQSPRVEGGPAWLNADRYDVIAKGSPTASQEQVWLMLRSLLAARFKVELRRLTKELAIYSLEAGKNSSKLPKRDETDCEATSAPDSSRSGFVPPCGGVARVWGPQGGIMIGQRVPMSGLADALSGVVDRPVVDRTGLTGTFDVELRWTPEGYRFVSGDSEQRPPAEGAEPGPSILTAVQEQLGLKLVAVKGPVEVLVIMRAEKPTEN
jgi:uncharacterized protein (TIGR03435 family)